MGNVVLGAVSVGELAAVGVYLGLVTVSPAPLFWAIISCCGVQPLFYYVLTVYYAFCSRSYPNILERLLNVAYLYSLYMECMVFKLEPSDSTSLFEMDGMVNVRGSFRRAMLIFHILTVTIPVEGMFLWSSIRNGFEIVDGVCVAVIAVAAICYSLFIYRHTRASSHRSVSAYQFLEQSL